MRGTRIPLCCSLILLVPLASECFAGLIGYWPLDEGAGSQALDTSGKGHNGPISGAAWATPGWDGQGACLRFDGVDDRVEVPHAADLRFAANAQYTLAAWVNWTAPPGHWSGVVTKGREVGNWYGIWVDPGNQWVFGHGGNNQLGSTVTAGVWIHVAMVYDNGNKKIYLNGKLDNETNSSQNGDNTGDLWFGAAKGVTEFAPARIDDIRIYDHALTAQEVKALVPPKLKAFDPNPADGAVGVTAPLLQWTKGETALFHNVYLGTTPELTEANLVAPRQPFALFYYVQGLQPGTTYYWRVDEIEAGGAIHTGNVWSFMSEPLAAYRPQPANGAAHLSPGPTLSWLPGKGAVKHQVYFSNIQGEVAQGAAAADKGTTTETKLGTGVLRASTTYYWRVDEIKTDGSSEKGPVWSFTTADGSTGKIARQWWTGIGGTAVSALTGSPDYPNQPTGTELIDSFEGPTDWSDSYGTQMYGWLTPPQSGDYTFWIASDDGGELWLSTDADPANGVVIARVASWTNSQEWGKEAGQKSAPVKLQGGQKYFIQALQKEGSGGDNLAVSWQGPGVASQVVIAGQYVDTFALPPLTAFSPSPTDAKADAPQDGALSWSAGEKAQKHEVYFGDDQAAVAAADSSSPLFKGRQPGTTFEAGDLEWGKTYYWRVDEIDTTGAVIAGPVWSFTTADFIPIDDFESYNDDLDAKTTIFDTWIDGLTDGLSNSVVGNAQAPFAERTIVHGGKQSMPMDYDNSKSPFFSEAQLDFAPVQDWTVHGVTDLTLYFRGAAANGAGALYVAVGDSSNKAAVVAHPDPAAVTATTWTEWKIPLSGFAGVNLARVKTLYLGVGDKKSPAAGGTGRIYIDDIRVSK